MGDTLGEKVGEQVGEKVGEGPRKESGGKVGGCLGEIDKLNPCQIAHSITTFPYSFFCREWITIYCFFPRTSVNGPKKFNQNHCNF